MKNNWKEKILIILIIMMRGLLEVQKIKTNLLNQRNNNLVVLVKVIIILIVMMRGQLGEETKKINLMKN